MHLLLSLSLACADKTPAADDSVPADDSVSADDSVPAEDSDTGYPAELNGQIPAERIPAPTFGATNYDGGARDRDDLIGHRTVMWFFPSAGTFG